MKNPFAKLVSEHIENPAEDYTNLTPTPDLMTPEGRQKKIEELKEWRARVEAGMKEEYHPDDPTRIEMIDEQIRKLENQ